MIQSNNAVFIKKGTSENIATFNADGAVELYHNNIKLFETMGSGCKSNISGANTFIIGSTNASGAYLDIDLNPMEEKYKVIA